MWIDVNKEMPKEGQVIDVWQAWHNPHTGEKGGRRLTNAWVHGGRVLHGERADTVKFFTHWMPVPKKPDPFNT